MLKGTKTLACGLVLVAGFVGGCGDREGSLPSDVRDGGTNAHTGDSDGRPSHNAYLDFAGQYCDGPVVEGASERVLLGETGGISARYGGMFFTSEPGNIFFYITESCELYTPQLCVIWETEGCVPFVHPQLPYTRTKLSTEELAVLMEKMRVLEWTTSFDSGDQFDLGRTVEEPVTLAWFGDLHFIVSDEYADPSPWEDSNPDEEKWGASGYGLLNERDYLLHDVVSVFGEGDGFRSPMKEMLQNAQEVTYDEARVVLMKVDPDSDFVQRQHHIYPWPMTLSPDDLHVLQPDEDYHFGTSNTVYGAEAEGIRQLVRQIAALDVPVYERDRAITVRYEDRMFIIQMRETLPFEGEDGLIHGTYDWWQDDPSDINTPF